MRCFTRSFLLLSALVLVGLTVTVTQLAQAQTFTVLHTFAGGADGGYPDAGLTVDREGNLYGTASDYGGDGYGTAYKLSHKGSGWTFTPLYSFTGGSDGANPKARVIFGPDGTLYGTTNGGGTGYGTVFNLRPFPIVCKTALCGWQETVLYRFSGGSDGALPALGDLIFDQAGNIYGTTSSGGSGDDGVVYEMMRSGSGWTESVLYSFPEGNNGASPYAGVIFDNAGNLYGTTPFNSFYNVGTVYELTPSAFGWAENTLYIFQGGSDGGVPYAGLMFDQAGNFYGATTSGGSGGGGTVFELTPSNGGWTLSTIYSLTGSAYCGPHGTLVMDGAGNLYGTTNCDGPDKAGSVFKLTPSGNSWTYTALHDFTGGSDGAYPSCNVVFDANGNLYGTTFAGGMRGCNGEGCGVVWEITP